MKLTHKITLKSNYWTVHCEPKKRQRL